jgi:O-succinylbenzoate synthase
MKIKKIELVEINMPLIHFFETSFGRTFDRRIILARLEDGEGNEGWGECTCGENPSYSYEWTDTCWSTIEKILSPCLVGREFESAADVWGAMKNVKGNRMAKATLETAAWDLEAKSLGVPLWKHLGGVRDELNSGVSIGIQDTIEDLIEKIRVEVNAGYQRIKIKIAPGRDHDVIARVREEFGDILLMGDANSAFSLDDIGLFKSMEKFDLMMYEQPLAHDDIIDHAKLQSAIETPVCLDESIHSPEDARKAVELKACKIINIKLGRVGGHAQAREIQEIAKNSDIPVWCGGMLEGGIGRAHNIAMSTLEGFTMPGDVSASARYWKEDIIEPEVVVSDKGTITVPVAPGIGFEVKRGRIDDLTVKRAEL